MREALSTPMANWSSITETTLFPHQRITRSLTMGYALFKKKKTALRILDI